MKRYIKSTLKEAKKLGSSLTGILVAATFIACQAGIDHKASNGNSEAAIEDTSGPIKLSLAGNVYLLPEKDQCFAKSQKEAAGGYNLDIINLKDRKGKSAFALANATTNAKGAYGLKLGQEVNPTDSLLLISFKGDFSSGQRIISLKDYRKSIKNGKLNLKDIDIDIVTTVASWVILKNGINVEKLSASKYEELTQFVDKSLASCKVDLCSHSTKQITEKCVDENEIKDIASTNPVDACEMLLVDYADPRRSSANFLGDSARSFLKMNEDYTPIAGKVTTLAPSFLPNSSEIEFGSALTNSYIDAMRMELSLNDADGNASCYNADENDFSNSCPSEFPIQVASNLWSQPINVDALTSGLAYTAQIRAFNQQCNKTLGKTSFRFIWDNVPPSIEVVGVPGSISNDPNYTIQVSGEDIDTYQYLFTTDSETCTAGVYSDWYGTQDSISLSAVTDGQHFLCVRARDIYGNVSSTHETYSWMIDQQSPQILSFTTELANGVYPSGTAIDITVNLSESISLDGAASTLTLNTGGVAQFLSANENSLVYRYLVGSNDSGSDLDVTAFNIATDSLIDLAGNSLTTTLPASGLAHGIDIDGIAPANPGALTILGLPAAMNADTALNITGVDSGAGDVFEIKYAVRQDGTACEPVGHASYSPWVAKNTNITDAIGADGSKRFCVYGRDAIGNIQSLVTSATWTKDTLLRALARVLPMASLMRLSMYNSPVAPNRIFLNFATGLMVMIQPTAQTVWVFRRASILVSEPLRRP